MSKPKGMSGAQLAELRDAGQEMAKLIGKLSARVSDLNARIAVLDGTGGPEVAGRLKVPAGPRPDHAAHTSASVFVIRVEPLRELAMAAMAETALRDLPSVVQVVSVERAENWANFTLEARDGADLVEEMKGVMPVRFTVTDSSPGRMAINLAWAWGEPESQG